MQQRGVVMALPAEVVPEDSSAEHAYLVGLTLRACQLAKVEAAHVADALVSAALSLYSKVDECERELDRLDRELDQRLIAGLAGASEPQRREMLACLKCMIVRMRIRDIVTM